MTAKFEAKFLKNIFSAIASFLFFTSLASLGELISSEDQPLWHLQDEFYQKDLVAIQNTPQDAWTPVTGDYTTRGNPKSTPPGQKWFKTNFKNTTDATENYVLEVGNSYWAEVAFFVVQDGQIVYESHANNNGSRKFAERDLLVSRESFPFTLEAGKSAEIYLKTLADSIGSPMSISIKTKLEYNHYLENRYLAFGLYFGSYASLVIFNLFVFAINRSRLNLVYVCYQTSSFILVWIMSGIPETDILADKYDLILHFISLSSILVVFFGAKFVNEYLRTLINGLAIELGTKILRTLAAILLIATLFLPTQFSHAGVLLLYAMAGMVFIFYLPTICNSKVPTSFVVGWSGGLSAGVIMALALFGIFPLNQISAQIYYFGCLWVAVFLSKSIGDRLRIFYDEKRDIRKLLTDQSDHAKLGHTSVESQRQTVAILAIDLVNFSQIVAKTGTERTVKYLILAASIVHEAVESEGGSIERSLGDGFFALFGQRDKDIHSHSLRAFRAAEKIQKTMLERSVDKRDFGEVPLQFRIGAHCGEVEIGNLGDENKFDFSAIGHEMSVAGRLEKACIPFKIMLSQHLWRELPPSSYDKAAMNSAYINSGEGGPLILAYEYDPNRTAADKLAICKNLEMGYYGHQTPPKVRSLSDKVTLHCHVGTIEVIGVSDGNLHCSSAQYFGKGTRFMAKIATNQPKIDEALRDRLLDELELEVRSGAPDHDRYVIELSIHALSSDARIYLFDQLIESDLVA